VTSPPHQVLSTKYSSIYFFVVVVVVVADFFVWFCVVANLICQLKEL
jgi:cation transport ATPase